MLHDIVLKGSTDRSVTVRIIDSTDGTPETGVVFNTSGIDLWYRREGAALTSITEATLAALTTAHADGGFLHVGHGVYRLDLPDAAFAAGANYVDFGGTVTGMIVIGGRVRLVDVNLEDSVRAGLTALPNAAAAASGGLFTRGTGAGQINQDANGRIDVNIAAISTDSGAADTLESYTDGTTPIPANAIQVSGDATAADTLELFAEALDQATGQLDSGSLASGTITASAIAADAITDAKVASDVTIASVTGAVGSVTGAVGSVTGNVGGNVVGSVASVTATVSADVVSVSGDSAAADNLEAEYDGTGYGQVLQRTTIATLASQTSFTLTAGSADDDAYNGCILVIQDASTPAQKAVGVISDYTGSTKTITLLADPAVFTIATTDLVTVIADRALKPTVPNRTLDVSTGGEAGLDWANIGSPTTAQNLSATNIDVDQVVASVSGAVGSVASGGITAASFAADAITAAKIAADVTTELQSGLATASALSTVEGKIDTIDTNVDAILVDTGTTLQGELDGIQADTEDIQSRLPAALVSGRIDASVGAMAAGTVTAAAIATGAIDADALAADAVDEILDEQIGDSTITMRQALKLMVAALGGKLSGAATTTVTIRNAADDADRITATVDSNGNRSAVTLNL